MIIDYAALVNVLDSSPISNQEVEASQSLVITFGKMQPMDRQVQYESATGLGVFIYLNSEDHIVGLEFI